MSFVLIQIESLRTLILYGVLMYYINLNQLNFL